MKHLAIICAYAMHTATTTALRAHLPESFQVVTFEKIKDLDTEMGQLDSKAEPIKFETEMKMNPFELGDIGFYEEKKNYINGKRLPKRKS